MQWVWVSVKAPELRDASRQFDIPGCNLPALSIMQHSTLLWQLGIQFSSSSECCQAWIIRILVLPQHPYSWAVGCRPVQHLIP